MITQTLKLNLIPGQVLPRVNVSQYDAGTRTLQMLLYNGDQAFNISSGMSGFVQGTKPDRTGFQYPATVTQGSNVVTLVVTQQMTAVRGEVTCELVLADGDNRIATVNFIIYVEPAALADDTVISDTELPLIEEAAELAQRIDGIADDVEANADRAETAADNAELWASRSPYIGQNGNWFVFDTTTGAYIDTQISATGPQGQTGPTGPQGPQGDAATITVGTVTTLPAGSQATVTNSGTSEAAVFNFGIPKGQDGTGAGDMAKADYDANGAVETAGGIASYVSSAISGKANKADLGTAAAKDSTNAVTNASTDLVESGAVYDAIQTVTNQVATKADSSTVTALANDVDDISDEIADMNNVLGAKNLLPNKAISQVVNGVTFTVNSDGSIGTSGTSTDGVGDFIIGQITPQQSGKYILSGCSGGTDSTYFFNFDDGTNAYKQYSDEIQLSLVGGTTYTVRLWIATSGVDMSNKTFYPMIRPASIKDDTYVPYAMTNRELTDDRAWEWATFNVSSGWNASIGLAYMNRPFRADKSSVMPYMKVYGQIQKTGSQTVSNGTLIATLADLSIIPSDFRNYSIPFITYDTSTGYIHSGLAFTTLDGTFKVRTNDSSFLTALNDGHIFHFSAMV